MKKQAVTWGLALLIAVVLLCTQALAKDRYFPVEKGRVWVYGKFNETGAAAALKDVKNIYNSLGLTGLPNPLQNSKITITGLGESRVDGRKVLARKNQTPEKVSIDFILKDQEGVRILAAQGPMDTGPVLVKPPRFFYKYPLKPGASWEYEEKTRYFLFNKIVPMTAKVESLDATVVVPAGAYDQCLKVVRKGEKAIGGTSIYLNGKNTKNIITVIEESWFAPGVGLVQWSRKEITDNPTMTGRGGQEVLKLESCKP